MLRSIRTIGTICALLAGATLYWPRYVAPEARPWILALLASAVVLRGLAFILKPYRRTRARPYAQPASGIACPDCGAPMAERIARRGRNAGSRFLGCSRFPDCRGTRSALSERTIAR
jgi:Topoisomerase DNA binding C4 zinc finger